MHLLCSKTAGRYLSSFFLLLKCLHCQGLSGSREANDRDVKVRFELNQMKKACTDAT